MTLRYAEATKAFIKQYSRHQPHAQLLLGPEGSGLHTLALELAHANGQLLAVVKPEQKSSTSLPAIAVDRIRSLYEETRSKHDRQRFVLIDDADTMNHVGQNALLKLLEEPTGTMHFILTSHHPELLLPTIRSRTASFNVPKTSTLDSHRQLKAMNIADESMVKKLLFIADGLPAELARLASDPKALEDISRRVLAARRFVEGTTYDRLTIAMSLKDDRQASVKLIAMIVRLLRQSVTRSPEPATLRLIDRMIEASEHIRSNGATKLQFANAVTSRDITVL